MASKDVQEKKRQQFLWTIGELYAKTSPELSRFYLSKYQSLMKPGQTYKKAEKLCSYCGNLLDGQNSRTRILKKIRTNKDKMNDRKATKRLRKKCVIATKCDSCEKMIFNAGCEKTITQTHVKTKKEEQKTQLQREDIGPTTLPDNYSTLSSSAKRKWRSTIRTNKMKEQGVFFWKGSADKQPKDTKNNLMAFLSTIEK